MSVLRLLTTMDRFLLPRKMFRRLLDENGSDGDYTPKARMRWILATCSEAATSLLRLPLTGINAMILQMAYDWRRCFATIILLWVIVDMVVPQGESAALLMSASSASQSLASDQKGGQPPVSFLCDSDCFCGAHVMPSQPPVISSAGLVVIAPMISVARAFDGYIRHFLPPPRG